MVKSASDPKYDPMLHNPNRQLPSFESVIQIKPKAKASSPTPAPPPTPEPRPWPERRPKTFGDCTNRQMPCPWVGCKHHLFFDIHPVTGSLKVNAGAVRSTEEGQGRRGAGYRVNANMPTLTIKKMQTKNGKAAAELEDEQMIALLQTRTHTCVLKLIESASSKFLTLEAVGAALSITRERVRQIETKATAALRAEPGTFVEYEGYEDHIEPSVW